jgi:hypothetical protein
MNLFIEIENGMTKNHPANQKNLLEVFGSIPSHWEPFTRVDRPVPGVYQVLESDQAVYAKVNGVWTDVWSVREMTEEEKTAKQQAVITTFNAQDQASNWSAWTFDEVTCKMIPPIPYPAEVEGVQIAWCGADNNWKEAPAYPVDDNQYKFDFSTWQWVPLVN